MIDHDLTPHRGERIALLAELGENEVLGGQDGGRIGSIAGSEAAPAPRMAMPSTLKRGPVSTVRANVSCSVSGCVSMASSAAASSTGRLSTAAVARAS